MKKFLLLFVLFTVIACGEIIDRPKNLLSKDTMANAIAELAIADQLNIVSSEFSMNDQTVYVFNSLKIKPKDFMDSYKYYIAIGKMDGIFNDAQGLIISKDPKAKNYIKTKKAEIPATQ